MRKPDAAQASPVVIKLKVVPDADPRGQAKYITYTHRAAEPTRVALVKNPPWHWLDQLAGIGYHCVSYQLQGK